MTVVPAACGPPSLPAVRTLRLRAAADRLQLVRGDRVVRNWQTAPDGPVRDAVLLDGPAAPDAGRLGAIDLRDSAFGAVLRIPLDAWTPEADDGTLDAEQALAVSGIGDLLAALDLPVRRVRRPGDDVAAQSLAARPEQLLPEPATLPWLFPRIALSLLAAASAIVAVLVPNGSTVDLVAVYGFASSVVALAALDGAVRWAARAGERRTRPGPARIRHLLAPRPAAPVPAGFLAAKVTVLDDHLVITGPRGSERWLPLTGTHAVRSVAVVMERPGRGRPAKPSSVELRTEAGYPRAVLPYADWFAADGTEALRLLADRSGLTLHSDAAPALRGPAVTTFAAAGYGEYRSPGWLLADPIPGMSLQVIGLGLLAALTGLTPALDHRGWPASILSLAVAAATFGRLLAEQRRPRRTARLVDPAGRSPVAATPS